MNARTLLIVTLWASVGVVRADDAKPAATFRHSGIVRPVLFTPDSSHALMGNYDRKVRVLRLSDHEIVRDLPTKNSVLSLAVSPDSKRAAAGGFNGEVIAWELASGKELFSTSTARGNVSWLAWSPDDRFLATADYDGSVGLYDVKTGRLRRRIGGAHTTRTWCVAFSPDGKQLASSGDDNQIKLWDPSTGDVLARLVGHQQAIGCVSFSADGRFLVSASQDGRVLIWEVRSAKEVLRLRGEAPIQAAFAPDARSVLMVHGQEVVLFDAVDAKVRAKLTGHTERVLCAVFAPNGKYLLTGSQDKSARLWNVTEVLPPAKPMPLREEARQEYWKALAGDDAANAYQAIVNLATDPAGTLDMVEKEMLAAAAAPAPEQKKHVERIIKHIQDLDSADASVRDAAMTNLEKMGAGAEPYLRKALKDTTSLEVRIRCTVLLDRITSPADSPDQNRGLRALAVLERIGDERARKVVEKLSKGNPDAPLTQDAKATLARMTRKQGEK